MTVSKRAAQKTAIRQDLPGRRPLDSLLDVSSTLLQFGPGSVSHPRGADRWARDVASSVGAGDSEGAAEAAAIRACICLCFVINLPPPPPESMWVGG